MQKLLTVFGATGAQGGSVIKAVLGHPDLSKEFKLRGVTRDPTKPASKKLVEKGVDVVQADLDDKESLIKALEGSHTVFAITNFWEKISKDVEVKQGKNIADACKAVGGVQHLIWSSLGSSTKASGGKYTGVAHFDSKAEIEQYMRDLGLPITSFQPGRFMSGIRNSLQKAEDGTYTFIEPDPINSKFPYLDTEDDTGKFVCGIIRHRDSLLSAPDGGVVLGASAFITLEDIVKALEKVGNTTVKFQEMPGESWKTLLPPAIANEMVEMMYYIRDFGYYAHIPDAEKKWEEGLKLLDSPLTSVEEYIRREKLI